MGNLVNIDDFRKKPTKADEVETHFGDDLVADHMANDLVQNLLETFVADTGADLDTASYAKTVEALVDVTRMLTRRHMGSFDVYNGLLDRDPESEVLIGVGSINEEELFDGDDQ